VALLCASLAPPAAAAESARVLYMLHCQGCHLPSGEGTPGAVPALRESVARFALLPAGREYLVRVPGSALAPLGDAELAAVLNWIVQEFGPARAAAGVAPFAAEEVRRLRARPLTDVEEQRAELVRQIEAAQMP
jgi:mono/diheme cytochrome c family protein